MEAHLVSLLSGRYRLSTSRAPIDLQLNARFDVLLPSSNQAVGRRKGYRLLGADFFASSAVDTFPIHTSIIRLSPSATLLMAEAGQLCTQAAHPVHFSTLTLTSTIGLNSIF